MGPSLVEDTKWLARRLSGVKIDTPQNTSSPQTESEAIVRTAHACTSPYSFARPYLIGSLSQIPGIGRAPVSLRGKRTMVDNLRAAVGASPNIQILKYSQHPVGFFRLCADVSVLGGMVHTHGPDVLGGWDSWGDIFGMREGLKAQKLQSEKLFSELFGHWVDMEDPVASSCRHYRYDAIALKDRCSIDNPRLYRDFGAGAVPFSKYSPTS